MAVEGWWHQFSKEMRIGDVEMFNSLRNSRVWISMICVIAKGNFVPYSTVKEILLVILLVIFRRSDVVSKVY